MNQQINLYKDEFIVQSVVLPAKHMLAIMALCVLVMFICNILAVYSVKAMEHQHKSAKEKIEKIKTTNIKLQTKLDAQQVSPDLQLEVAREQEKLTVYRNVENWLDVSIDTQALRFSELLAGLGRQHVPGLWFSHIGIHDGGISLELEGSAVSPKLIPQFLGKLNQEAVYAGKDFRKMLMQQDSSNPATINFLLAGSDKAQSRLASAAGRLSVDE